MGIISSIEGILHQAPPTSTPTTTAVVIPNLASAIHAAAPQADSTAWAEVLGPALVSASIATPRRMAAFLGNAAVEAGPALKSLSENLYYTHAERIVAVYPREVPTLVDAERLVSNPEALANCVYANRMGNGDEDSGDGSTFSGRGIFQLTGRTTIAAFGESVGMGPEDAAAYAATQAGAAASACWFWNSRKLSPLADAWSLSAITRAINGPAMLGNIGRIAAANAALRALGGAS
jgi:putative chitinase